MNTTRQAYIEDNRLEEPIRYAKDIMERRFDLELQEIFEPIPHDHDEYFFLQAVNYPPIKISTTLISDLFNYKMFSPESNEGLLTTLEVMLNQIKERYDNETIQNTSGSAE